MSPPRKEPNLRSYSGRCGRRLRELREKAGLTVEQLAAKLGVSWRAVYYWETGRVTPKWDHYPKLARLFGIRSPRNLLPED